MYVYLKDYYMTKSSYHELLTDGSLAYLCLDANLSI